MGKKTLKKWPPLPLCSPSHGLSEGCAGLNPVLASRTQVLPLERRISQKAKVPLPPGVCWSRGVGSWGSPRLCVPRPAEGGEAGLGLEERSPVWARDPDWEAERPPGSVPLFGGSSASGVPAGAAPGAWVNELVHLMPCTLIAVMSFVSFTLLSAASAAVPLGSVSLLLSVPV